MRSTYHGLVDDLGIAEQEHGVLVLLSGMPHCLLQVIVPVVVGAACGVGGTQLGTVHRKVLWRCGMHVSTVAVGAACGVGGTQLTLYNVYPCRITFNGIKTAAMLCI
eukprot:scaffold46718_cov22-Tisochrysis_lutea.AAC.1